MLIKPNWEIFKAEFSNPQDNFEWFCYLLFSKEYNQPYGIHRYKKQSGIETDPIGVNGEVIGWQSKFYDVPKVETLNRDLKETLRKAKRDYPNITKIVFYTNMEWTKYHKNKDTKAEKTVAHKEIEELFEKEKIELVLRMDSYFEIYCQEKRNLNISRYFFERDTKWELTNNGFKDTLRYCYLKNFKTISLLDEKKKRVLDIFVNLAIIKERKEEKTKDKLLNRETFLSSYEEIHKPKEPIEIKELINTSKKSLIYGKAGVGKTTLCKYIAYKWAKGELYNKFEYVVYIPLRKWDSTQLKEVIRSHYYSQYKEEIDLDIKENSNKILFLFDGYDELKSDKRDGLHKAIRDNKLTNYIITTRPYGYQKSDFRVDEYFETIGFSNENVNDYIDNFFVEDSEKSKSLQDFISNNNRIVEISKTPLILEILCILWIKRDDNHTPFTTTSNLYKEIINLILKEHHERNRKDENIYEPKKREKIEDYLGQIAFKGIEKQLFHFNYNFFKEIGIIDGEKEESILKNSVLNSGFLLSDRSDNILLDNKFEFIHLTFQEYFSALYVSKLSKEKQKKIIRNYRFYPNFQVFFSFLAGLIDDKQFLLDEIESEPKDFIGWYELNLILGCLQEIRKEDIDSVWLEKKNELIFKMLTFLKNKGQTEKYNKLLNSIYSVGYLDNHSMDLIVNSPEKSLKKEEQEPIDKILALDIDFYTKVEMLCNEYQEKEDTAFISYLFDSFFNEQDSLKRDYLYKLLNNDKYYKLLNNYINSYIWENIFWERLNKKTFQYLIDFINKNYFNAHTILHKLSPIDDRDKKIFEIAVKKIEQSFFDENFSNLEEKIQCDIVLDIIKYSENHQLKIDASLELIRTNVASSVENEEELDIYDELKYFGKGNQKVIDILFEAFQNIKNDWYSAMDSADTLSILDPKNPKLVSMLFQTFEDKSLNIKARVVSAELLSDLECDKNKLLNNILNFSYEEGIDIKEKIHFLKYIFQYKKVHHEDIPNRLKEIFLTEESLSFEIQIDIIYFLIFRPIGDSIFYDFGKITMMNSLDKRGQRQIKELIKYVDNKKIALKIRKSIAVALCLLEVTNNQILQYCIEKIQNNIEDYYIDELFKILVKLSTEDYNLRDNLIPIIYPLLLTKIDKHKKYKLIDALQKFSIEDNEVFYDFVEFVKNNDFDEKIYSYIGFRIVEIISNNFKLFKQALPLLKKYRGIFLGHIDMEVLFKAYDEKYFDIDDVIERVVYIQDIVYIKNKRLYSIENNVEIFTRRKVNIDKLVFRKGYYLEIYGNYNVCNTGLKWMIHCILGYIVLILMSYLFISDFFLDRF